MAHNYIIILRRKVQIAKLMAEHIKILPIEFYDGKSRSHPTVSESRPIPLPIFIPICVCPYGLTPHSRTKNAAKKSNERIQQSVHKASRKNGTSGTGIVYNPSLWFPFRGIFIFRLIHTVRSVRWPMDEKVWHWCVLYSVLYTSDGGEIKIERGSERGTEGRGVTNALAP